MKLGLLQFFLRGWVQTEVSWPPSWIRLAFVPGFKCYSLGAAILNVFVPNRAWKLRNVLYMTRLVGASFVQKKFTFVIDGFWVGFSFFLFSFLARSTQSLFVCYISAAWQRPMLTWNEKKKKVRLYHFAINEQHKRHVIITKLESAFLSSSAKYELLSLLRCKRRGVTFSKFYRNSKFHNY